MADSSVNSNGNVPPYYEEKKPTLYHSDKFTILSANGSVHYDREMLKRTMLVHEATFRKQVYELHRLYKIQKDLMAQFQGEEFNDYPGYADTLKSRAYASQAPPGDVKGVWQTGTLISGHGLKHSSIDFINETSTQYSVNGASLRCSNIRPRKKMLDLQLPADVYADDDDVEILDEDPLKCLLGTDVSAHDGNDRINLGNNASKHVKSWATDTQPHNSVVHILNKPVEEPSNTKITDFIGVGISTQDQHNLSHGVNSNLLVLQGNSREKLAGEASGSSFFGAKESRHVNSFRQRKDDPKTKIAWLQHEQNGMNSSFGQYLSSNSSFNHLILAPPLFNDALNSLWQSNNTSHYGISMGSTNTPYHHRLKIHGKPQDWKPSPRQNIMKDLDLNDVPADTAATWQEGSESSLVDTSAFNEKPINLIKSQVPPSCANGISQTFVSSTLYSDNGTVSRIPSFPTSTTTEKDSQCSPTLECDINIATSIKREADKEMQSEIKNSDSSFRNLFDLNEAFSIMDDLEVDACEPEGVIAPREPNDSSRDSPATTAAENLVAMGNDGIQPGSPQLDTLHWFADLATSKENNDTDDDFEALTLKLEETKSYKFFSALTHAGDSSDGHRSAASLLVTRPRRGKARGCPPKKKDILSNLASLPDKEVSEDLHWLGRSKLVTPAKQRGRNGQQTRGSRRPRSVAAGQQIVEEVEVSPASAPPPPLVPADLDADAPRITRWGRTTRRCRRARYPPVNNASLHVA